MYFSGLRVIRETSNSEQLFLSRTNHSFLRSIVYFIGRSFYWLIKNESISRCVNHRMKYNCMKYRDELPQMFGVSKKGSL